VDACQYFDKNFWFHLQDRRAAVCSFSLNLELTRSPETSANVYQITRRRIPGNDNIHSLESLMSHKAAEPVQDYV
jgi:hypothetical protein